MFLRGACYAPSYRFDELTAERFDGDLRIARDANVDALRIVANGVNALRRPDRSTIVVVQGSSGTDTVVNEGLLAGLFAGTRTFSVRQLTLAFADAIGGIPQDVFKAQLSLISAIVVAIALVVLSTVIAIRRLSTFEISGEGV